MKRPHWLALLTVCGLLTVPVRAADNLVIQKFSDYLDALRIQTGIPGLAATIVSSTDIAWEGDFGFADVDRAVRVRADTPFHVDGLTQTLAASLVLRCDESGWISLEDRVAKYSPASPDASATLRQILTHTTAGPAGLTFAYRLDRLASVAAPIATCTDSSFRFGISALLDRMGMADSVPGADAAGLPAGTEGFSASAIQRYAGVVSRLAVSYSVDGSRRATASRHPTGTLAPGAGLITTTRDLAKFDVALKSGIVMRAQTLAAAWTPPLGASGQSLPHGIGWFVQAYNGEPIVWQFGESAVSSSLVVSAPRRGLTLILLANSAGLSQSFGLAGGDLNTSPFARLFLSLFVR